MTSNDNIYYIFIEEQNEKCVIKLVQNYDWDIILIKGTLPEDIESYSIKYNIDDIMDDLISRYDYVEEISFEDIDDYME